MKGRFMLINKNDKFSIRKFKNGRSDSVKIEVIGVIVGTAIALSAGANSAEAAVKDNTDGTTTISNKKATTNVETANVSEYDFQDGSLATKTDEELAKIPDVSATRSRETDPSSSGTNEITKTGKVDYKYVTTDNTVLEENKKVNDIIYY